MYDDHIKNNISFHNNVYNKLEGRKNVRRFSGTITRIKDGIIDGSCDFVRPSQLSPPSIKAIGERVKIKHQAKSTHEKG